MTKLHLQLILHLYPGRWMALNVLSLRCTVPGEALDVVVTREGLCASQNDQRRASLAFARLQLSVPLTVAMHFKTKGICNKGQGSRWENLWLNQMQAKINNLLRWWAIFVCNTIRKQTRSVVQKKLPSKVILSKRRNETNENWVASVGSELDGESSRVFSMAWLGGWTEGRFTIQGLV